MADNPGNLQQWYACKLKVLTQLIFETYSWKRLEAWNTIIEFQDVKIQSWDSSFTYEFQEAWIFEFRETKLFRKERTITIGVYKN